jgi:hypothetical protein
MQIDESAEHSANADAPISESFEPDSKITAERVPHCSKQQGLNVSMCFRTVMDPPDPK